MRAVAEATSEGSSDLAREAIVGNLKSSTGEIPRSLAILHMKSLMIDAEQANLVI